MDKILKKDEQAVLLLRKLYQSYGYQSYKMSRFEEYDLYVRNKDFLVSDQVITFSDRRGKPLALKPDVTLSIIKNAGKSSDTQRVYYNENVYRVDPQTRAFREIMGMPPSQYRSQIRRESDEA
jgi:ATP phosphoribosyltransferase regulatory subunit